MPDGKITLLVGGQEYAGWKSARITRAVENCAADFDLEVTERWAGNDQPWQIKRFDPCVVAVDGTPVLTGYVDFYGPSFDSSSHTVRIAGRSKTCDVVDCMPEIKGGQFNGYTLDRIARAVCAPFGVQVVVAEGTPLGGAIPDATLEKTETGYEFLEKLCGLQGVLAFDDADGNLVLAQAGAAGAAGALTQGDNILYASGQLAADQRFQQYVVLAQAPLTYDGEDAQLEVIGKATDNGCPRYRRYAESAQDPADTARANLRANWRKAHNFGKSTQATIGVQGFYQPNGELWQVNTMVPVKSPWLAIDQQLLIGAVSMILDDQGSRTEITVAPQEAYLTQPPKAKNGKKAGGGSASIWSSL